MLKLMVLESSLAPLPEGEYTFSPPALRISVIPNPQLGSYPDSDPHSDARPTVAETTFAVILEMKDGKSPSSSNKNVSLPFHSVFPAPLKSFQLPIPR